MAKITIKVDTRFDTLEKVLANLGFVRASKDDNRAPKTTFNPLTGKYDVAEDYYAKAAKDIFDPNAYKQSAGDAELRSAITEVSHRMVENNVDTIAEFAGSGAEKPKTSEPTLTEMDGDRKRGDPSAGRKRRTAEQVEEDRLYFSSKDRAAPAPVHPEILAMAQGPIAEAVVAEHLAGPGVGYTEATKPSVVVVDTLSAAISSGEDRVNPEDAAQVDAAQDAADEAAETAQRPAGPPTLEDLRATVALYIDKFGHAASVKNMKTIIGCAVADCPVDEIPNAIAKVKLALSGSTVITPVDPSTGKANEPETAEMFPEPVTASPAEVVEAIKAYARAYDGTDTDQDAMVVTKEDLPKVFSATFGKGVTGMGSLPDKKPETLGKILVAIKAATSENMFERRPYAQAPK